MTTLIAVDSVDNTIFVFANFNLGKPEEDWAFHKTHYSKLFLSVKCTQIRSKRPQRLQCTGATPTKFEHTWYGVLLYQQAGLL